MRNTKIQRLLTDRRRSAAGLIGVTLLLALTGCNQWRKPTAPQPTPAQPTVEPSKPPAQSGEAEQQQNEAEARAADLFNRGENDLACEQVERALALRARAPISEQLERFQQACTPN
ncbi:MULTISPECIES: hypothetical protein [unclassified Synechococcus]|uniref:hypothetical protein n=1 Tax=unclassified Synechococcus TaxID=2626047 RepID=UPI001BDD926F|nr:MULTISPECIES: hypothetical protein [unclassified Synechococcus]QVV68451.1 hypothetical protein KJJ24_04690 [Synechococcus sp. LA31]CAK6689241.1 hypothetical protein MNNICLKF_00579 [Synechococcus sp. CBW1107]